MGFEVMVDWKWSPVCAQIALYLVSITVYALTQNQTQNRPKTDPKQALVGVIAQTIDCFSFNLKVLISFG